MLFSQGIIFETILYNYDVDNFCQRSLYWCSLCTRRRNQRWWRCGILIWLPGTFRMRQLSCLDLKFSGRPTHTKSMTFELWNKNFYFVTSSNMMTSWNILFQNHKNFYLVTSARHGSGQVRWSHTNTNRNTKNANTNTNSKNANTNTNTTNIAIHGSGKARNLLEMITESGQLEVDASELGDRPPITGASGI